MSIIEKLSEGIVNRDMKKEGHALLNKWSATGLLEGLESQHQQQTMEDTMKQPEIGIIIEDVVFGYRLAVLSECEYVSYCSKIKGVRLFNFDTGEIEIVRQNIDWWNQYYHPVGWNY